MINTLTKENIIEQLRLEQHPLEGGYFRRTYESTLSFTDPTGAPKKLLSSIYYLLTSDNPIGHMHKNQSDIIHYFHLGSPITYILISPEGELTEKTLGHDITAGQHLQMVVPGGYWKASVIKNGEYGLISEAVTPGFEYSDNELATKDRIKTAFPQHYQYLEPYIQTKNL